MSAAYLYHVCQNHPFVDGNKRTALGAAVLFLMMNGIDIDVDNDLIANMVFEVAKGKMKKEEIVAWFRKYINE